MDLDGAADAVYRFEISGDLKRWRTWIIRGTDPFGHLEVMSPKGRGVFFRVVTATSEEAAQGAVISLGERLFLETRFAQFFYAHCGDDVNQPLAVGDPALDQTVTITNGLPGPFRGQSMNCRACHLLGEFGGSNGNRTLEDFARRSPVPDRGDGRTMTSRNSPSLVNASVARAGGVLLHYDGEFASAAELVRGTLLGRNFGWFASERDVAIRHVARVIREDDGTGALALRFGGAYAPLFRGDPSLSTGGRIPKEFQVDVRSATDEEVVDSLANILSLYLESLVFSTNSAGEFDGSPYDAFLDRNRLPRKPEPGETDLQYSDRLLELLRTSRPWQLITPADGSFALHDRPFVFGDAELQGLKIFLTRPATALEGTRDGVGNCAVCHPAPAFTDHRFHNTGVSQDDYDRVHGPERFAALEIPGLKERQMNPDGFLPPSAGHPGGSGRFASPAAEGRPGDADLGLWNVFANPEVPGPQGALRVLLREGRGDLTDEDLLPLTVALFKTPGLRDLEDSAPYFHSGMVDTLADALHFYHEMAHLSRNGAVVNGDLELSGILLSPLDSNAVETFLRSLTEDYP